MLFGVTCTTLGYSSIQIGILARVMHGLRPRLVKRVQKLLTYDRGMIASAGFMLVGLMLLGHLGLPLFETWAEPASYLPSSHSRSTARYPWIPDILFHAADGNGKARYLNIPEVSLRAHESYGQHGLTLADRLGVWLSQRAIRRHLPNRNDLEVLELGCGYRATQLVALGTQTEDEASE